MVETVIAQIDVLDPWTAGAIGLPATPAGWPEVPGPSTVLGQEVRDWLCTLPQMVRVVDQGPDLDTWIPGTLAEPMNMEIALLRGSAVGRVLPSFGEIRIDDHDARYAAWSRYAWRGGQVTLWASQRWHGKGATPLACFVVDRVERTRLGLTLVARGLDALFDESLHRDRYGGTGGLDGDAAVAGQVRPRGWGALFNVSPKLISAAWRVYQVDTAALVSVDAARDGGAVLTVVGDYPDWATLVAAPLAVDEVATCLALGLVRTGGTVQRAFTIDCVCGAAYTTASLINALIAATAAGGRIAPLSGGDVSAFDAEVPGVVGLYLPTETTIGQAIDRVATGNEIVVWCNFRGELKLWQPKVPAFISTVARGWSWPRDMVAEPRRTRLPHRRGTVVAWQLNWTPQGAADLDPTLSDDDRRLYGQAAQSATVLAAGAAGSDPGATLASPAGLWRDESSARAAAVRANAIFGVPCELRTADVFLERSQLAAILDDLTENVQLSDGLPVSGNGLEITGPLVNVAVAWARCALTVGVLTVPGST